MKTKEVAKLLGLKNSVVRPIENQENVETIGTEEKKELMAPKERNVMKKELKTEVTMKKRTNWKKVALVSAGALAAVGGIAALIIKSKSGATPDPIEYWVDDNGTSFMMNALFNKNNDISKLSLQDVTAKGAYNAIDYLNPDVWGVDANQFKWDEVIFIKH